MCISTPPKYKSPLKPQKMFKLAHQAIWDHTWWSASAAEIAWHCWPHFIKKMKFGMSYKSMRFILPFTLNLNPPSTPPNSPLSIRQHVPCSGEAPRWLQLAQGGLRKRAEHTSVPPRSPRDPPSAAESLRWSPKWWTSKDGGSWMVGREKGNSAPRETFMLRIRSCTPPRQTCHSHLP